MNDPEAWVDVMIVGGGQSALASAYFLRRTALSVLILDEGDGPGGAWRHGWDSLHLFSPAQWSSLPGWQMPETQEWPSRDDVLAYLTRYESRYEFTVARPERVNSVHAIDNGFALRTSTGTRRARAVISATGTWRHPYVPDDFGADIFEGRQLHSASYRRPDEFAGKRVLVVGGGNSGAQILAEVSRVAETTWVTPAPPRFLPDEVDGRALFERATAAWQGASNPSAQSDAGAGIAEIVMVPSVIDARSRGVLHAVRPFVRFTPTGVTWSSGQTSDIDAVIWCTGFRPALDHLHALDVIEPDGRILLNGTRSSKVSKLWLVGYGDWTGFASATLIGVMRSARATALEVDKALAG